MSTKDKLTRAQQVLIAARLLEKKGVTPFTAEDLVVESWNIFKNSFSLQGYDLPDSNRVFMEIMGRKTLKAKGWIEKVGKKQYRLSEAGKLAADSLSSSGCDGKAPKALLDRSQIAVILRVRNSKALMKWHAGRHDEINFTDACSFWGISARSSASKLQSQLSSLESIFQVLHEVLEEAEIVRVSGSLSLSSTELEKLEEANGYMQREFSKDLDIIAGRSDDRAGSSKS